MRRTLKADRQFRIALGVSRSRKPRTDGELVIVSRSDLSGLTKSPPTVTSSPLPSYVQGRSNISTAMPTQLYPRLRKWTSHSRSIVGTVSNG